MEKLRHKIRTIFICISLSFAGIVSNLTAPAFFGFNTIIVSAEELPADTERNAMMIILMMMLSSGLRFTGGLTEQLQAVKQAYTSYTADNSSAPSVSDIAAGSSIYGGSLRLTDSINNGVQDFINTYAAEKGLSVGASGTFSQNIPGGGTNYVIVPQSDTLQIMNGDIKWSTNADDVRSVMLGNLDQSYFYNNIVYIIRKGDYQFSFAWGIGSYGTGGNVNGRTVDTDGNVYWYTTMTRNGNTNRAQFLQTYGNLYGCMSTTQTVAEALKYTYGAEAGLPDTVLQGESLELKDGIMLAQEQAKLIDMSYLLEYAAQLQDSSVPNAITSVSDIADVASAALEVSEAQTGAQSLPWETVNQNTTTQVIPSDQTQTSDSDISQYKVIGLQNVFPFSIPWDIYYFFKLFNATPEPIQFSYPINVYLLGEFTISVDCSPANDVAAFCRSVFLLLFIFGLIMKTRDIMRS